MAVDNYIYNPSILQSKRLTLQYCPILSLAESYVHTYMHIIIFTDEDKVNSLLEVRGVEEQLLCSACGFEGAIFFLSSIACDLHI